MRKKVQLNSDSLSLTMKIFALIFTFLIVGALEYRGATFKNLDPRIEELDDILGEILRENQRKRIQGDGDSWNLNDRLKEFRDLNSLFISSKLNDHECQVLPHDNDCQYLKLLHRLLSGVDSSSSNPILGHQIALLKKKLANDHRELSIVFRGKRYSGENNVEQLMTRVENPKDLKQIWLDWNRELKKLEFTFMDIVELYRIQNIDPVTTWNAALQVNDQNSILLAENLWSEVLEFYNLLHKYVHDSMNSGEKHSTNIPIQLTGSFSAVQWDQIFERIRPYPEAHEDVPDSLENFLETVFGKRLFRKFLKGTPLEVGVRKNNSCHPLTFNTFQRENSAFVRLCVTDFGVSSRRKLVHEFGHVLYFNAYKNQTNLARLLLSNSVVHESIGEAMLLVHNNCKNRGSFEARINGLLREALTSFVRLPYALSLEKWRLHLFANRHSSQNSFEANREYWQIRRSLQNLTAPEYSGLQPLSKFHVTNFMPYLPYYFSVFVNHQILEALCIDVHDCCLEDVDIGKYEQFLSDDLRFWDENWQRFSGKPWSYDAEPLLRFYKPLILWLKQNLKK